MIQERIKQQLINQKRQYIQNFQKVLDNSKFSLNLKQYSVVSIIGVQGSGKSTLLNALFGTTFQILSQVRGNQTTKGIWLSIDVQNPLLIMDVEGNDSIQNRDPNYQKTVAMYALTLSNVLIINVWSHSIGTSSGSQYEILKTLMEMSLKLFKHQTKKILLFCIRDADGTDINTIYKKIKDDIVEKWKTIAKPPHLEKHQYDRFFRVEIHSLRKYNKKNPKNFEQDVAKLRTRLFNSSVEDFIFKDANFSFNLPLGDLPNLSRTVWKAIIQQKQFNLPHQKIQISNFRTSTIRQQIIEKFIDELNQFGEKALIDLNLTDIGEKLELLMQSNISSFQDQVNYYDKKIVAQKRKQLIQLMNQKIEILVQELAKVQKQHMVQKFSTINFALLSQEISLKSLIEQKFNETIDKYQETLKSYKFNFPQKKQFVKNLEVSLRAIIVQHENREYQLLKSDNETLNSRMISEKVAELICDVDQQFWKKSQLIFEGIKSTSFEQYRKKFRWIFNLEPPQIEIDEIQQRLNVRYKEQLKSKMETGLSQKIFQLFEQLFYKNEEEIVRNWLVLPQKQIEQIFTNARNECLDLIKVINNTPNLTIGIAIDSEKITEELFDQVKLNNLIVDVSKKMTDEYQKIKRIKIQSQMSKIPWYYWIILIFFVYDDIWYGAEFPIIYYPSVGIFSLIGLFVAMGKTKHLLSFWQFLLNKLKKHFKFLR